MKKFITAYLLLIWFAVSMVLGMLFFFWFKDYLGLESVESLCGLFVAFTFIQIGQFVIVVAAFVRAFKNVDEWFK